MKRAPTLLLAVGIALVFAACHVAGPTWGAELSGAQQVPPVETEATGNVVATIMGDSLRIDGDFGGLSSPPLEVGDTESAAHIHMVPPGQNGPTVLVLGLTLTPTTTVSGACCWHVRT